jgi:hypothetical protein
MSCVTTVSPNVPAQLSLAESDRAIHQCRTPNAPPPLWVNSGPAYSPRNESAAKDRAVTHCDKTAGAPGSTRPHRYSTDRRVAARSFCSRFQRRTLQIPATSFSRSAPPRLRGKLIYFKSLWADAAHPMADKTLKTNTFVPRMGLFAPDGGGRGRWQPARERAYSAGRSRREPET